MTTIYNSSINGIPVRTGDIICTSDGLPSTFYGRLWQGLGLLVPGAVDHCILYIGPGDRCVEAGARGVITFEVPEGQWDAAKMYDERWLLDSFYGIAYPLAERDLPFEQEATIRAGVAQYCLDQADTDKPYNPNFFDPESDAAFYCSQLIYKAYSQFGINLNCNKEAPMLLGSGRIVFPQELWAGCANERYMPNQAVAVNGLPSIG